MNILNLMFEILINIKHAHLMTTSNTEHVATDKLYDSYSKLYDKFLEVYIGKYGREKLKPIGKSSMVNMNAYNGDIKTYLQSVTKRMDTILSKQDSEIQNIVDDIKNTFYHSIYMLSLQ